MYISKIVPSDPKRVAARMQNEYALHQLVWQWFSRAADQERDFLYRVELDEGIRIYTYSSEPPQIEKELFNAEVKSFGYMPKKGHRLAFMVRVNPVVSKCTNGKRGSRHDVVMAAKAERAKQQLPAIPQAEIEYMAIGKWLGERASRNGFQVEEGTLRVSQYAPRHFYKRAGGAPIHITTADLQGTLIITDPDLFGKVMKCGIGPAKGFGCGMLMLRPV